MNNSQCEPRRIVLRLCVAISTGGSVGAKCAIHGVVILMQTRRISKETDNRVLFRTGWSVAMPCKAS